VGAAGPERKLGRKACRRLHRTCGAFPEAIRPWSVTNAPAAIALFVSIFRPCLHGALVFQPDRQGHDPPPGKAGPPVFARRSARRHPGAGAACPSPVERSGIVPNLPGPHQPESRWADPVFRPRPGPRPGAGERQTTIHGRARSPRRSRPPWPARDNGRCKDPGPCRPCRLGARGSACQSG
jgi:hypothetical protein